MFHRPSGSVQLHSSQSNSLGSHSPISQPQSSPSSRHSSWGGTSASSRFSSSFVASLPTAYSTYSMDHSRKRSRQASERDEPPPWECDPTYGIVHSSGCNTCRSYIAHLSDAKAARSPSIQRAFRDQASQLDSYFHDGVTEGRRNQRAEDEQHLREAAVTIARMKSESHEVEQQLRQTTDRLHLAQLECETLRKRFESLANEKVTHARDPEADKIPLDPGKAQDAAQQTSLAAASAVPSIQPSKPEDSSGSCTVPQILSLPVPPPSAVSVPRAEAHSSGHSYVNLPQRPTTEVIASSGVRDQRTTSSSFSSNHSTRTPKTIRQLQILMNKAHQPGNEDCIAKVKMLCADAHQTPREEKTELQRYILANWRNPELAVSSATVMSNTALPLSAPLLLPDQELLPERAGLNNPRVDDPVEVWHAYLTQHRSSWPRGVRIAANGSPHMADLRASRTIARLRPVTGQHGDTSARNEFMACAVGMFAAPGMYADLLRRNGIRVESGSGVRREGEEVRYRPYRATQFSLTAVEVARHLAAAGVSVEEAVRELEPWAREYQAAVAYPSANIEPRHAQSYHGHHHHHYAKSTSGSGYHHHHGHGNNSAYSSTFLKKTSPGRGVYNRPRDREREYDHEQEDRFGWR